MTKINLQDFCIAEIEDANEQGIIFKTETTALDDDWKCYKNKTYKNTKNLNTFITEIKSENQSILAIEDLKEKNVLNYLKIKENKQDEEHYNLKKKIKNEVLTIFDKNKALFNILQEKELTLHRKLLDLRVFKICIKNHRLCIYFDDKSFIPYDDFVLSENQIRVFNLNVLGIKVYYKNMVLCGYLDKISEINNLDNVYNSLQVLNRYNQMVEEFQHYKDKFEIFISNNKDDLYESEDFQDFASSFLNSLYVKNRGTVNVNSLLAYNLGFYFLKKTVGNSFKPLIYEKERVKHVFIQNQNDLYELRVFEGYFFIYKNGKCQNF